MRPAPPPAYTSSWSWAWGGSISRASTASSTRASARSCSTLKNPAPVANSRISSSRRMCTRVPPALSVATSGACRARIPISPAAPGTISISTSPSNAGPSGVTSERSNVRRSCATAYLGWNRLFFPSLFRLLRRLLGRLLGFGLAAQLARLLDCLLDRPDHVERLLGQLVVLAVEDLLEAFDRVLELHILAGCPRELLRDEVRLREEALDLARALDDELVLVGELVHAEDGDDVLQVAVTLQDLLDTRRRLVVLVRDDSGLERPRERVERVDGGVDPLLDDRAREDGRRVKVGERVGGRRVGQVVGRDVDRLHRRDRACPRRRDALLELAHLGRQGRLVADGARHPAEQRRDLRARLDEPEDVVDEEQRVLALVAEVLRHRQAGETDAEPRSGRLVHLPVDERDLVEHARLAHLEPEIVALTCAFTDAGEDRDAAVLPRDVVDQFLDQHRLPDPGAAEEPDLAALHVRSDQVDDLDPRLEDLDLGREVAEARGIAVDRPALDVGRRLLTLVDRLADHVPEPAERGVSHRHGDRPPGVLGLDAAREAVRRVHRDRPDAVVAKVLLNLRDQLTAVDRDAQRAVDRGQFVREYGIEDDALDLHDPADVSLVLGSSQLAPDTNHRRGPDV